MDAEIKQIQSDIEEIKKTLLTVLKDTCKKDLSREWYTDKECFELKGGGSLNTYRTNRFYQIKGGIPDATVNGRHVWSRESVIEWLIITDDHLEEYHEKYKTGAKRK